MALRVSPVRATSSEREAGPWKWSSRRMMARLALRTVSDRTPVEGVDENAARVVDTADISSPPLR